MPPLPATQGTWIMAGTLPIKNANNLKIYFNNSSKYACQLTKPLKFKRFPQSQARKKLSRHGLTFSLWDNQTTKEPSYRIASNSR
jgi:hypothetical protein